MGNRIGQRFVVTHPLRVVFKEQKAFSAFVSDNDAVLNYVGA